MIFIATFFSVGYSGAKWKERFGKGAKSYQIIRVYEVEFGDFFIEDTSLCTMELLSQ